MTERSHTTLLALLPLRQRHRQCVLRSMDWMKASLQKATSLIASGETPMHIAACGAASRDYVFDGPEL